MFFLKRKKINNLYQFLIDDYGMTKIFEKYNSKIFGNFHVRLSSNDFFLNYIMDRGFFDILIESNLDYGEMLPLSFIENYIYNPQHININATLDNFKRIEMLNNFIKKDFDKISILFNNDNYLKTKQIIDSLLKEQFLNKFPTAIKK